MAEQTFITCPHCGEPIVMSPMQLDIYRGRALTCARCARQFTVEPKRTPLYALSETGGARLNSASKPATAPDGTPGSDPAAGLSAAPTTTAPAANSESGSSPRKRRSGTGGWMLVAGIVGGFFIIAAIAASLIYSTLRRAEEDTNRIRCASNLSQIGAAIQAYARTNQGRYPDKLDRLLLAQTVTPGMLVCPSSTDTPVVGSTPQAWLLALQQRGHQSYVYVGDGLTIATAASQTPSPVVMYEPLSNHADNGATVLYADGTVTFLDRVSARAVIARFSTPTLPAASQPMTPQASPAP